MKQRDFTYFVGDFETTVYDNQEYTEVWASAVVPLYSESVIIHHSLLDTFNYLKALPGNICIYYHNLKFDGSFWLPFLIENLGFKQAYLKIKTEQGELIEWKSEKKMFNKEFKYSISDRGAWYNIIIKVNNKIIEIRDSLKLLPFSVAEIGKSFGTKHKKLDMEYKGFRFSGCEITPKEKKYIANDVLVVKEALEIMFDQGHDSLTIGSCCLKEFKRTYDKEYYNILFPNMYDILLDKKTYGAENAGQYIKRSYKGGWCYYVEGKQGRILKNGLTADVNSLYPSEMHSDSGNYYPVGKPKFWSGDYIPDMPEHAYYFVRVRCRFYLKDGMLPFIQIKNSFMYLGNVCLTTSDVWDDEQNSYCQELIMPDGAVKSTEVTLTLTMIDWILFKEHYELVDCVILDGCWFHSEIGLFDEYINLYKKIKEESKGAIRTLAKLFMNNLYGKLAASDDSSFKIAYIKDNGSIGFKPIKENKKQPGYIPCGSAITSYARNFTIRAAQKNFYGADKPGFAYADTDSLHCDDMSPEDLVDIPVHESKFCHWKLESFWDRAIFTRQKTYIEHVTHENQRKIDTPYYDVKGAGIPERSKKIFIDKIEKGEYDLTDFKVGLKLEGKLVAKRIKGGTILKETTYEMR